VPPQRWRECALASPSMSLGLVLGSVMRDWMVSVKLDVECVSSSC
jgi:hypothetical protein